MERLRLTRKDRTFLAYALDHAAAHLAERAEICRALGTASDIIAKYNTDEDTVRDWITRFDPNYVS